MKVESMKKTVLYDKHIELGAKMAPFGGFEMPIQYDGIINEHQWTRTKASLFDTCHMGEFYIKGKNSTRDMEAILSCAIASMEIGQCRYGFICNELGGAVDDQIIYRLGENEFFMVVNAGTKQKDYQWLKNHVSEETEIEDISSKTAKIDLQGPLSAQIMQQVVKTPIDCLKYFRFMHNEYKGERILISRTGYTGEIGFEVYVSNQIASKLWDELIVRGARPAGLGARDTLRLEMGMPLYGHELNDKTNPAQTGISKAISSDKEFIGSKVVNDPDKATFRLVGLKLEGKRAARAGDVVVSREDKTIGYVTSGSFGPSLGCAVALGYVEKCFCNPQTPVMIRTERQELAAKISELPMYKEATGRKELTQFLDRF